ncbi:NAD(P)/FAD-dependent oxidoreductase [Halomonas sp. IOP_31]|uniref:NAD(P)/FAD-dependent oxidoreductase n=1 Tax=Halomonas sp. IOP_31 TaxID=2876584 RepID=UPI0022B09CA0|nr:FAD-dependent oxidoreductase [Halomonas sp. IOP_31]MCD6009052.1 FAD-dependent oxidoreductase [Halomonas sp. IOP_31]
MYDMAVIGGGPAGMIAATTAARRGLKVLLAADSLQGQLGKIDQIENWPGEMRVTGSQLAASFAKQITEPGNSIDCRKSTVAGIRRAGQLLKITLADGDTVTARTAIIATGVRHGTLGLPGEKELSSKGVSYCVTCDGPYFKGKKVAVIGRPEQALAMAQQLSRIGAYAYLLQSRPVQPAFSYDRVTLLPKGRPVEIIGDQKVAALRYHGDHSNNMTEELPVSGVFIAAECMPNTEFTDGILDLDEDGHISVDCRTMAASVPGVYAAGDVTSGPHKQITTAVGDGVKAALSATQYIDTQLKREIKS